MTTLTQSKIKKLRKRIQPAFSEETLGQLSEEERLDFQRFKLIPLDLLVPWEGNYKSEDPEVQKALTENIRSQGQSENINVQEMEDGRFLVGNGNHRLTSFSDLGRDMVLVCEQEKDLGPDEFLRRCIVQNETRFTTDNLKLGQALKQISLSIDLSTIQDQFPFPQEKMENLIKMTNFDFSQFGTRGGEGNGNGEGSGGGEGGGKGGGSGETFLIIVSVDSEEEMVETVNKLTEMGYKVKTG